MELKLQKLTLDLVEECDLVRYESICDALKVNPLRGENWVDKLKLSNLHIVLSLLSAPPVPAEDIAPKLRSTDLVAIIGAINVIFGEDGQSANPTESERGSESTPDLAAPTSTN